MNKRRYREQFVGPFKGYDHAAAVRAMPCALCGKQPPSEPHHVKSRGAGGKWSDMVPLCFFHHRFGHNAGWAGVQEEFGVNLEDTARRLSEEATNAHSTISRTD